MLLTKPYEDEFILSHLGRIRILNDISTNKQTLALLRKYPQIIQNPNYKYDDSSRGYDGLLALSLTGNHKINAYINNHTLLPYIAISFGLTLGYEGPQYELGLSRKYGRKPVQHNAIYCRACADEDQRKMGFSYWRRQLQLPGIIHCREHGTTLYSVKASLAFEHLPCQWTSQAKKINLALDDYSLIHQQSILRYCSFIRSFLNPKRLITNAKFRYIILKRSKQLGISSSKHIQFRTIFKIIQNKFPKNWLSEYFPEWFDIDPYDTATKFDNFYYSWSAPSPQFIGLVFSALIDDTKELLEI